MSEYEKSDDMTRFAAAKLEWDDAMKAFKAWMWDHPDRLVVIGGTPQRSPEQRWVVS
jgi:hypothetical protein